MKNIVKLALKIATEAHKGQFRRDGVTPYIEHPKAVAKIFKIDIRKDFKGLKSDSLMYEYVKNVILRDSEILQSISLLHDVIEDTNLTLNSLVKEGIPLLVIDKINKLTKRVGESYLDYILQIKRDQLASLVKIEDIKHNLSTLEPNRKTTKDKYLLALYILEN